MSVADSKEDNAERPFIVEILRARVGRALNLNVLPIDAAQAVREIPSVLHVPCNLQPTENQLIRELILPLSAYVEINLHTDDCETGFTYFYYKHSRVMYLCPLS